MNLQGRQIYMILLAKLIFDGADQKGKVMGKLLKACWCFVILGLIWQGLELLIYGQIQLRVVDDIMGLLFFPFIYKSMG